MNAKTRTSLVVAAPLVAVATLAIGLRVGAGSAFHAALLYAAPPGRAPAPAGPRPYAFQLVTYLEDRGVREVVAMKDLSVIARTEDGQESRWTGASNVDGIAEVALAFKGDVTRIAFEARVTGEREPLAIGIVEMTKAPPVEHPPVSGSDRIQRLRPSKREGSAEIDVFVDGDRLVVGGPTSVFVRVKGSPRPAKPYAVHATPEIGVRFTKDDVEATCADVAVLEATALGQAASTLIEVTGDDGAKGSWFGTLPTAPGAFMIEVPRLVFTPDRPTAVLIAPNSREVVYVEIDGEEGREFGAVLPLRVEPGDPLPRARLEVPVLAEGLHWIVASGDPRGAERLTGATIAKTFLLTSRSAVTPEQECEVPFISARRPALGFPRWLAIDGIATRGAQNRARHRKGLFIGLAALGAAALLEVLLLTAAAREAKLVLAQAENESPERVTAKPPGGGLVVALLVALLGFAFLAALIIAKA